MKQNDFKVGERVKARGVAHNLKGYAYLGTVIAVGVRSVQVHFDDLWYDAKITGDNDELIKTWFHFRCVWRIKPKPPLN